MGRKKILRDKSQDIVNLYNDGLSTSQISKMYGTNRNIISNILEECGVGRRKSKYNVNQHYFDNIDTPNKAYILGLLYADGCNFVPEGKIILSLQESDIDVIKFVKKELEYSGPILTRDYNQKNPSHKKQYALQINNRYLSSQLERLGMVQAKSLILKFPEWLSPVLYSYFILGYYDGDGSICYDAKREKCNIQIVGTKDICEHISNILLNIGCKNHIIHPKKYEGSNTYIMQITSNQSSYIYLSYIYNNPCFYMIRKYQKYLYFEEKYLSKNNTHVA